MKQVFLCAIWNPSTRVVDGSLQSHQGRRKEGSQLKLNRVDYILRCEEHRPQRFLTTEPDDQSESLQGDPVAYALLRAREETRVAAE